MVDWHGDPARITDALSRCCRAGAAAGTRTRHDGDPSARLRSLPRPAGRGDKKRLFRFRGVWDAICSAAGLVRNAPSGGQIVRADYPTTRVEIVPQMLEGASAESIGRGATLALRCTMCHGAHVGEPVKSPAETRRIEASGTTVICGHDDAQWDTPTKGADFYD